MTIRYKILGIPKTFDEFIDRIKRNGQTQVNITTWANYVGSSYYFFVKLQAGKTRLKNKSKWYATSFIDSYSTAQRILLEDAIEKGQKLQSLGLEIAINGESIDKTRERTDECRKREVHLIH